MRQITYVYPHKDTQHNKREGEEEISLLFWDEYSLAKSKPPTGFHLLPHQAFWKISIMAKNDQEGK